MIQLHKIRTVLMMAPLCSGDWIKETAEGHRYCSQGALLRAAGWSQERLAAMQETLMLDASDCPTPCGPEKDEEWFQYVEDEHNRVGKEIYGTLEEEYGIPQSIGALVPSWNDGPHAADRANYVYDMIVLEALRLGLTTGQDDATVKDANTNHTQAEKESPAPVGARGDAAHEAEASDDTDGPGEGGRGLEADDWTLGGRSVREIIHQSPAVVDLALALMGQASG